MRTITVFLILLFFAATAQAKTIRVPKGSIRVDQLHEEILTRFPSWRGTPGPDGIYSDPLLRVEHTDAELILHFPDGADEAALNAVLQSHVPDPNRNSEPGPKRSAAAKLTKLGFTKEEILHILK